MPESSHKHLLFIDGHWCSGQKDAWLAVDNPATSQTVNEVAVAEIEDLDIALNACVRGFSVWRKTPAIKRADVLLEAARLIRERLESLAQTLSLEQGKPLPEARMEINSCAELLQWYAEEGRRACGRLVPARDSKVINMVRRDPVGPVAAFSPWNFPASQAVRKLAPALAAGCSIILKGPEEAPGALIGVVQALVDAGLPDGVLALVFGRPAEISAHLIASPIIRKVSFTGSVPVGKLIATQAAQNVKPCTLELGGHAPVLVFEDVDILDCAQKLAQAKFRNAGQVCVSPTRFYIQQSVFAEFTQAFVEAVQRITIGAAQEPTTQMGPLINQRRRAQIADLVADAKVKGATVLTGGGPLRDSGYFFAPTVLTNVPENARAWMEEPFGPLALLAPFNSVDEAIELANNTTFGLAAYAFSHNLAVCHRLSDELITGMLAINHFALAFAETPFGGVGESGYGREGGSEGLDVYLVNRLITQAVA